jgi:hypothetical protein
MPENIRPTWQPTPKSAGSPQPAVANVGSGAEGSLIRPQPAVGTPTPSNPTSSKGAVSNVGSGVEGSLIRPQAPK